jgi:hypothetical protein
MTIQRDTATSHAAVPTRNAHAVSAGKRAPSQSTPGDPAVDEAMTSTQAAQLKALAVEAAVTFDSGLSRQAAAQRIEELQRELSRRGSSMKGGDGGASIRANEAPSEDQPPLR